MMYALSEFCGSADIITPVNDYGRDALEPRNLDRLLAAGLNPKMAELKHIGVTAIRAIIPEARDFFTFCFERSPWEKAVSAWQFAGLQMSFRQFLKHKVKGAVDYSLYANGSTCLVDSVGQYADLYTDYEGICEKLKIPQHTLPWLKKTCPIQLEDCYTEETRDRVSHLFQREIAMHGYRYPPHPF